MKKATKRTLAILLAACLLLSLAFSAGAAGKLSFGAQITISKQPTDLTFIPGLTSPSLAGLELRFKLGGVDKTLRYDSMWDWDWDEEGEPDIYYSIDLYYPEEGAMLGANIFFLNVNVSNDNEYYSQGNIPIAFTGVKLSDKFHLASVPALTAGLPNKVLPLSASDSGSELNIYSFTPKVSGNYNFSSIRNPFRFPGFNELLYPFEALWDAICYFFNWPDFASFAWIFTDPWDAFLSLFASGSDPVAMLADADGNMIAYGDDHEKFFGLGSYDLNFNFNAKLEGGKTYYLVAQCFGWSDTPYLVTPMFVGFSLF